ncbi:TNF receptor-associated factor 5-like isoform X2 [Sycon ciliatum]
MTSQYANPWTHPIFIRAYSWWICNLDPQEIRSLAYSKGLLTSATLQQLRAKQKQSPMEHNEHLIITTLKPGGMDSFKKFLDILQDLGPNFDPRRKQLESILSPLTTEGISEGQGNETLYPVEVGSTDECAAGATGSSGRDNDIRSPTSDSASAAAMPFYQRDTHTPYDSLSSNASSATQDTAMSSRFDPSLIESNTRVAKNADNTGLVMATPTSPGGPRQMQGGYQAQFTDHFPDSYKCPICLLVLRDPVQTGCGHRYCRTCIMPIMNGSDPICPVDRTSLGAVFADKHCQREIGNFKVQCDWIEKCGWSGTLKYLEEHLSQCKYVPVKCINAKLGCKARPLRHLLEAHVQENCEFRRSKCRLCGESVPIADMERHFATSCLESLIGCEMIGCTATFPRKDTTKHLANTCQEVEVSCPYGCPDRVKRRQLHEHTSSQEGMLHHLKAMFGMITTLRQDLQGRDAALVAKDQEIRELHTALSHVKAKCDRMERDVKDGFGRQSKEMADFRQDVNSLLGEEASQGDVAQRLGVVEHRVGAMEVASVTAAREAKEVASSSEASWRKCFDSLDLRVFELETSSYSGVLMWKFTNFWKHFETAKNGSKTSHYSQPFYSSRHGYKACARLYPNGDGAGFDKYISIFFVIMAGEYDALLTWPFNRRITLTLLDQSPARRDISETFMPDVRSTSFQKPTSGMNVASGCPCFVSHKIIQAAPHQYAKNDTLYLRIKMDTTGLDNH